MIWCYLLLLIIIYIIFNYIYIKEPICVRDDGKSHVRDGEITINVDSEVLDPCRAVANTKNIPNIKKGSFNASLFLCLKFRPLKLGV